MTYTVDAANLQWVVGRAAELDVSQSEVVRVALQQAVDTVGGDWNSEAARYIFEKKRGCKRKKRKVQLPLHITEPHVEFLGAATDRFELPNAGKTLRIVLDWCLEG